MFYDVLIGLSVDLFFSNIGKKEEVLFLPHSAQEILMSYPPQQLTLSGKIVLVSGLR